MNGETMTESSLDDPDVVLFAGLPPAEPGDFVAHSLGDKLFGRRLEDVKADWSKISRQIGDMVGATAPVQAAGFDVDSVEISLGFTATGKLAFIAEAGVEASVTITLARASSPGEPLRGG
jgi:hypothetical protein